MLMSLFRQYFSNCFSTTKTTLKSFSLSIKSASVFVSVPTTLKAILSLTPRSTMPSLQGIKNMDIFQNNKCNFPFLGIALIPLSLIYTTPPQHLDSTWSSPLNMTSASATEADSPAINDTSDDLQPQQFQKPLDVGRVAHVVVSEETMAGNKREVVGKY
ncbi:hypothetical protein F2Q70_00015487 [Brassica cretica]|uniref:Uncharacterized protein n=1 Tax=Brassica cretica TaxID=69181 RepID=A0A8S9HZK8_BRACR|nr:hypothetical protein F2Q70_00015487 [Brassica cretica]